MQVSSRLLAPVVAVRVSLNAAVCFQFHFQNFGGVFCGHSAYSSQREFMVHLIQLKCILNNIKFVFKTLSIITFCHIY